MDETQILDRVRRSNDYRECCRCRRVVHRDEAIIFSHTSRYTRRICLWCVERLNELARVRKVAA